MTLHTDVVAIYDDVYNYYDTHHLYINLWTHSTCIRDWQYRQMHLRQ